MAPNSSKSSSPAYVPWRHCSELAMVRDWFYPSHLAPDPYSDPPPDMRQAAVQHVQMWSFKDPKLPHAIIATANLTDAMLHDTLDRRKVISDCALRSVYAMAFCRFVNGFVDRDIAKAALRVNAATKADGAAEGKAGNDGEVGASTAASRGESSMYAHAAAIGLPEQFVDLRHRATHDEIPSLEVLRTMARRGLDWLWERWWKVHATDDPGRALREREERRLLGQKKAEARRANKKLKAGTGTGAATDVTALNEVSAEIEERKRGLNEADPDAETMGNGHKMRRAEKLTKVKMKHGKLRAFGLFEV